MNKQTNLEETRLARSEQAHQTRQRLFDAAYALLQEVPFENITIRNIVELAGVSTGTFYLYFPSKLDVYYETYVIADKYFVNTVSPMLTCPSTKENLLLYFDQYAIYNSEYTSLRLTKLLYNPNNTCFLRDAIPGMRSVLMDIVQRGLDSNELDAALSVEQLVTFLMDSVRGLVYSWCLQNGAFDLRKSMQRYVTLLYRAVCNQTIST